MPRRKQTETKLREQVAHRVRQARLGRSWTQEQLAEALGVSVESVSRYEGGKLALSLEMLERVARALDTSVEALVRKQPAGLALEDAALWECWHALDKEGQRRLLGLLQWMSGAR